MTATAAMDRLDASRDQVGESPLWSVAEQALYWVDIEGRRIRRFDWATRRVDSWQAAERVACIALHARGGLLAAMESGVFHVRAERGVATLAATRVAAVEHPRDGMRFNDGRCDRQGRFWASTMVRDMSLGLPDGALFRLDGRGLSQPLVSGLVTGNGLAFSPRGDVMYLSDSHPSVRRIWAFDLDADGTPRNRREFVDMNLHPGRPDGAAVDADGGYWICANDAGLVHRFTPEGRLDRSLPVPVPKPAMCAFGGPQLRHLFITSIRLPTAADDAPDGSVFVTEPGAGGLPEAAFAF